MTSFPVAYDEILAQVNKIDPVAYERSRNFLNGKVTRLSPYISRGVISPRKVLETLAGRGFKKFACEKLAQELGWREYFQRVLQHKPDLTETFIRNPQQDVRSGGMPAAIMEAATGIEALDDSVNELYRTGYMHNHMRMYVASVACNVARCSWQSAGRWMYFHLLDADPASNFCSWQWICAAFSGKRYFANQENINKYCGTAQRDTFLDIGYEEIENMKVPAELQETITPLLETNLPVTGFPEIDPARPLLIYDFFNLDPSWHALESCNRVLLLEPSLFRRLPVSQKVIDFVLGLSAGIPDIQVFVGEFGDLVKDQDGWDIIYREHPLNAHYRGRCEDREWMFPEVKGYFPSFSAWWKKCVPYLNDYFK